MKKEKFWIDAKALLICLALPTIGALLMYAFINTYGGVLPATTTLSLVVKIGFVLMGIACIITDKITEKLARERMQAEQKEMLQSQISRLEQLASVTSDESQKAVIDELLREVKQETHRL